MGGSFAWLAGTAPFHAALAARLGAERPELRCRARYLNGTESVEIFRRERADVLSSGLDEAVPALRRDGLLADLRGRPAWERAPRDLRDPSGAYVLFAAARSVIVYDPARVERPPRSLAELADPRWRGSSLVDPRTCGFGVVFLRFALSKPQLGEEWTRAMGRNGVRLRRQTSHVVEAVARGESPSGVARDVECRAALEAGARIAWVDPAEGHLLQRFPSCLRADAPNAEAGGAFLDWMMEPATQAFLAAQGCAATVQPSSWVSDLEAPARADTADFARRAGAWLVPA